MLKSNGSVALARLRGSGSLLEVLEANAGEHGLINAFQNAGLPLEVLENRNIPIPLMLMSSLFEASTVVAVIAHSVWLSASRCQIRFMVCGQTIALRRRIWAAPFAGPA